MTGEFDRQVATLLAKGYPRLARVAEDTFVDEIQPLRERAPDGGFVIVVRRELVPTREALGAIELAGKRAFTDMGDLDRFQPIDGIDLPAALAYLVADVDTGADTLNVTPDDALSRIENAGRSPLTIDEGVALVTHHPEVLKERNAFSILGSRCGDRRVPALWVSKGRPRLGWCWAGNPHTWLGSASCGGRIGASGKD